jgi:hypothetical protein
MNAVINDSSIAVEPRHLLGVMLANAILWSAALVVTGNTLLAGPAAVALISIGSLYISRRHAD